MVSSVHTSISAATQSTHIRPLTKLQSCPSHVMLISTASWMPKTNILDKVEFEQEISSVIIAPFCCDSKRELKKVSE